MMYTLIPSQAAARFVNAFTIHPWFHADCSAAHLRQARHIRQAWDVICEKTSELLGAEALANGMNRRS